MIRRSETLAQCEEAWNQGMPLKVSSDGFPLVMKPSMNCMFQVKGTHTIAYVGLPGSNKPDASPEETATFRKQVVEFLASVPRYTAAELDDAPDGIYTWLLYSKGGAGPYFVASRTETMLELGTIHYSIATSVGATAVHGAGELWKHGTETTFNFMSGTFMDAWRSSLPRTCPLELMQVYLQTKLQKEVLPDLFAGRSLTFTKDSFVTARFFKDELTPERLERYARSGFVVCLHDKDAQTTCKTTKAMCATPMASNPSLGGRPTARRKTRRGTKSRRATRKSKGFRAGVPSTTRY